MEGKTAAVMLLTAPGTNADAASIRCRAIIGVHSAKANTSA
jgi:hypothetical protein